MNNLRLLSLFSGGGGMDIGFSGGFSCLKNSVNSAIHPAWIQEDCGSVVVVRPTAFDIVFANDIRPEAKALWTSYFKDKIKDVDEIYRLGSIVDLVKREKSGEKIFPKDIDILIGGFPCQDFSVAGKRQGINSKKSHLGKDFPDTEATDENRGRLYAWMKEVVGITAPKIFIAENVKGLVNLEDTKEIIERDFAKAGNGGYLVVPARVLSAPDYGVPQSRERVFFFGFKKSALRCEAKDALLQKDIPLLYDPYPIKTHGEGTNMPIFTCKEAFDGLFEPDIAEDPAQKCFSKAKYMGTHCQGQTEVKLDSVAPTIRSEHHGNIEFRRLSCERGGKHFEELALGYAERRLTVRECARLQTFPDDYRCILKKTENSISVSSSEAYKIIGNAVPCVLAYNIAKNLEEKWELYFKGEKR